MRNKLKRVIAKILSGMGLDVRRTYKTGLGDKGTPNSIYSSQVPINGIVYRESKEVGAGNLHVKLERVKEGGPFEWPNIVALNQAVASFIRDEKYIVNIGAGTGTFEWFASVDSSLNFVSSEFDKECVEWCKKNRQRDNIAYTSLSMQEILKKYGKFDLALSIEVIEHLEDYALFLKEFSALSDRAIITTPNRDRSVETALIPTPEYYQHVREWDAGELYWILKAFYKNVDLYAMPDIYVPKVEKIGILSTMTPLIALCNK